MNRMFSFNEKYALTKDGYEEIIRFRKKFFANEHQDARECQFLNQEVALSWNRCRNMQVNHRKIENCRALSQEEYINIINKNKDLIDITRPLFSGFRDLATFHGNALYLFDVSCLRLLYQSERVYVNMPDNVLWDESSMGTGAHFLCMYLKRPVQLIGPEYYNDVYAKINMVVSAAPLMDDKKEVIGCIAFRQDMSNPPWNDEFQNLRLQTLGLIYSMTIAIENGLKLKRSRDFLESANYDLQQTRSNLETSNEVLETTWSVIDEGMVLIDETGKIYHANKEGSRILNVNSPGIRSRNIQEFFVKQSPLLKLVANGNNVDVEDTICLGAEENKYIVSIRPVLSQKNNQIKKAVIRLVPIEEIDALINKRTGYLATYHFEDIAGKNKMFNFAINTAKDFSRTQQNILLSGESGTGKELFAQAIHNNYRPRGPFVAVNCAAIPRHLIESELMGYEGGSFTGAERHGRPGKIELAQGGTLFLDEIGDMPFELQAVLLRVLEDKKIMRLGGRSYKKVDFKLIAATNRDLYDMVKNGLFREDLYYRLSVLTIQIPALREREDDIEFLSRYFIESYCKKEGRSIPHLTPPAIKAIKDYQWPGNVRQLENAMIYAVSMTKNDFISLEDLPVFVLSEIVPEKEKVPKVAQVVSLKESEKDIIEAVFIKARYNVASAARLLNISKPSMYRKLKKFNIDY